MATKPLQSIKFPGLDDTYTVPQVDSTLQVAGAAADAKKTGDEIGELNERLDTIENNKILCIPDYILENVVYTIDGVVREVSGCITYVFDVQQLTYHIKVSNRQDVYFGLSNTLYSGLSLTVSQKIAIPNTTEYDFTNNQNYKYLYITKKGQTVEYGIEITTNLKPIILGDDANTIDVASDHMKLLADYSSSYSRGYIISTTGEYYQLANDTFYSTDYIDIEGINKLIILMPVLTSLSTHAGAAFYDNSKTYISGVECSLGTSSNEIRTIDVPSNAKYIRTTCRGSAWNEFFIKHDDVATNTAAIEHINNINECSYGIQMFKKIGVIGDSISCGWAKDKNGNNSRRNLDISWPQQMARRIGCMAYNLGASGVDPVEWFQPNYEFAQYCYTQYQSVGECDLYIIGLGLNPTSSIGSVSDIDENDYTQNGETFYGQYARIIQMINDEHPNAIVMCLTEPTERISGYDTAVRTICALSYINAQLVDLENDYFDLFNTTEILSQHQPDGLHFTPYGYSLLASAMVEAINDYISKHTNDYKYVGIVAV